MAAAPASAAKLTRTGARTWDLTVTVPPSPDVTVARLTFPAGAFSPRPTRAPLRVSALSSGVDLTDVAGRLFPWRRRTVSLLVVVAHRHPRGAQYPDLAAMRFSVAGARRVRVVGVRVLDDPVGGVAAAHARGLHAAVGRQVGGPEAHPLHARAGRGDLGRLRRHLLVREVEEVDHPLRLDGDLAGRLRCVDRERLEELSWMSHRGGIYPSGCRLRTKRRATTVLDHGVAVAAGGQQMAAGRAIGHSS